MFSIFAKLITGNLTRFAQISSVVRPISIFARQQPVFLKPKCLLAENQIRTNIKVSLRHGKRKTVHAVVRKFFRLHWGMWIRTICGRHKKIYKKKQNLRRRLRQHVFCGTRSNRNLDIMVTKFWRKPKYYLDDPYEPYHEREEFFATYKKPREIY